MAGYRPWMLPRKSLGERRCYDDACLASCCQDVAQCGVALRGGHGVRPAKVHGSRLQRSPDRLKPNFVAPSPPPGAGDGGYFVFVGRLSQEKGLKTLLEAWSKFTGKLKILGDGPLAAEVAEFAAHNDSVEWLGQQPSDVVQRVVGKAVALIVPSTWYEGLPKTIIEAFSVGTPIIASDLGAMSEVVEPEKTGVLFQPGSAAKLVEALQWMAASPPRRESMRTNVRQVFERRYTAERNYQLLLDIYRQVLAESSTN